MADPYDPKLTSFSMTPQEQRAVAWALQQNNSWEADRLPNKGLSDEEKAFKAAIKGLKKRLKDFHLARQKNCCCYCSHSFQNRPIEQDREHIIPKSKHPELTFSVENLAVACKTCNMSVKKAKTSHLRGFRHGGLRNPNRIGDPCNYNIPHPNVHNWLDHLRYEFRQSGREVVCHYSAKTTRGRFAYYFFKLDELEIFSNTDGQRGELRSQPLHPTLVELRDTYNQ
ncbi:HNH endonuclease [Leisingera caerulea]|uniref:HNH endonuclease n=2 Tax=Leisingera caerulea TaxID=506591 RepID=A0A9Q9LZX4_LEICA|nr:HNH endonuclease [Leisingera caerulea]